MTPEEIENQFNALSSPTHDYSQERERERERVTSFNRKNIFRKIFDNTSTKQKGTLFKKGTTPVTSNRFIVPPLLGRKPWPSQGLLFLKLSLIQLYHSTFQNLSSGFRFGIGFMLAIFTAGIFAVSVTGTFNTFSSGTLLKSSDINANFATLKAAIESIPSQPSMRLIYETDVTSATNTVTVSGLDGNTDIEYHLSIRFVNPSAGGCTYYLKPNNDSSSIYGFQEAGGNAAAGSFARLTGLNTGMLLSDSNSGTSATLALYDGNFIVKTGAARGLLSLTSRQVSGDLISIAEVMNSMWNNSSSNITSLVFTSGSNCIGAGSHIEVWARR